MTHTNTYDIIVIGAGHAGCEAALASARMGAKTLLLTMNLDTVAQMSCNPAIGGFAKSHIVREIDALGGEMGKIADSAGFHFRLLNRSKGPAVWASRVQCDKKDYQFSMKHVIESQERLDLKQGEVKTLLVESRRITGVVTSINTVYYAHSVIVTTGTFLNGLLHIGDVSFGGGRGGEKPSCGLSESLGDLGFEVLRLKTGTPARINGRSIDFGCVTPQAGDESPIPFSHFGDKITQPQIPCYITYTNERTHEIIRNNLHRSPLYSGQIQSTGPRYCPSIESKIVRFPDKKQHQVFLEPEGVNTHEFYLSGLSTSLPQDVQIEVIRSVQGLENAEVMRYGYAVEYDFVNPLQLQLTLETKRIENLYLAGQINGTSGYEEAGCQGLMAGVNAVLKIRGRESFVLRRDEAYIGVLIDDLVTKGTIEPYRMFTSRAEYRLILRQDNADFRLTDYGAKYGLVTQENYKKFCHEREAFYKLYDTIKQTKHNGCTLYQFIKRPESALDEVVKIGRSFGVSAEVAEKLGIEVKYEGYVRREKMLVQNMLKMENKKIPSSLDFKLLHGLRVEAQEKLDEVRPVSLGQASRISGLSACDLSMLMIHIEKHKRTSAQSEQMVSVPRGTE